MIINIPILKEGEKPSMLYTVALRKAISSDGCSRVPDVYGHCCVVHEVL